MFKKKDKAKATVPQQQQRKEDYTPKYKKPKIILLDLPSTALLKLQEQGLNAVLGTLGEPYKVESGEGYAQVAKSLSCPNYTEQEIVIIDLKLPDTYADISNLELPDTTEKQWWAKTESGVINPRPLAMYHLVELTQRIAGAGGAFIAFASNKTTETYSFGAVKQNHRLNVQDEIETSSWSLIPNEWCITTEFDSGNEVSISSSSPELDKLLKEWSGKINFNCKIRCPRSNAKEVWEVVATNKYNDPIGLVRRNIENKSCLILLPQLTGKAEFISKFLKDVLPQLSPHLFPDHEGAKWIQRVEYTPTEIIELQVKKGNLKKVFLEDVSKIESEINLAHEKGKWMRDLLTESNDTLVDAVKLTLSKLGFSNVIDMDAERDARGQLRREDLQIRDVSPLLVVDIKGIGGYPADEECQQAHKHATLCMKEMGRTDIQSLTIINHQRNLPPLERENRMPFRKEILDYADEIEMGLLTTWDLWRLVKSFDQNGWTTDQVKPVLYRKGRISPIPEHYIYIGNIVKIWKEKHSFGVVLENRELVVGGKIAFEFPVGFTECVVSSLQVNGIASDRAFPGDQVGIQLNGGLIEIKEGLRLYSANSH